ncbi:Fe(3+) ABC transporter substrate-binding protein [Shewanella maritima]|uniref:Fe(3+) ABC transporter substrate-binding protein n=1 Tax=Shewanella maritima TaxID=2520507 RepID=A0A411PJH4_9GAMM|nr:Fe(3+) ABC transporter substrate-binding protein [Shewanella maritima]QBF83638.1 Fe(3+) ABC transporter substrate-binding protein [Shewanella maritima]
MKLLKSIAILGLASVAGVVNAAESLTVYSYRQAFLIDPILEKFTQDTGIKVDVVFSKKGIAERIQREGQLSPADVVLTSDFSRLMELVEKDLVAPVSSDVINGNIPSQFRAPDNTWYALTQRVRNVYSSRDRLGKLDINYEDLAAPKYKGKICTRSGKHPYNAALVASMIAHHGEAEAKTWLQGVKDNLARKPQGNDRAQVKAVKEGLCDIAIGNSYYLGKMLADPKQVSWAESVFLNFPNQANRGSHVNVSGMVLAKHSKNKDNAIKLMEFLTSNVAQQAYAEVNYEYPVNPSVKPSKLVASWGEFKADALPIHKLAENHQAAIKLLDEVKFDL